MASLIETLVDVLEQENTQYKNLLELSRRKTTAIVQGLVEDLQNMLGEEQKIIDGIKALEVKREENVKDIANVLNISLKDLKIESVITILEKQPKEQEQLRRVHSELKKTLGDLTKANDNNKVLLQESLDMIEFEMNLAKSQMAAPITANYSKEAHNEAQGFTNTSFDAKQ